jgi:hypothetical protein
VDPLSVSICLYLSLSVSYLSLSPGHTRSITTINHSTAHPFLSGILGYLDYLGEVKASSIASCPSSSPTLLSISCNPRTPAHTCTQTHTNTHTHTRTHTHTHTHRCHSISSHAQDSEGLAGTQTHTHTYTNTQRERDGNRNRDREADRSRKTER